LATFVLIHGAASDSRDWRQPRPEMEARGHEVVAPDLPCEDDSACLREYGDADVEALENRSEQIVVAHSLGEFTAPLVCDRVQAKLFVMVNGMLPAPGESPGEGWGNTGWNGRSAETEDEMMRCSSTTVSPELPGQRSNVQKPNRELRLRRFGPECMAGGAYQSASVAAIVSFPLSCNAASRANVSAPP
jgi:hypothetical protein